MKFLALAAISFYQRYLSPLKGFVCAFRIHTGRDSCSAYGKRVIARHGLLRGLVLLNRRLSACAQAHHRHTLPRHVSARYRAQAGHYDVPCDLPNLHCDTGDVCDTLDCASNCTDGRDCRDWWRNRRQRGNNEQYVRMPPPPGP
jgi:putative component of membrane protein insertase Oxa1/YidC/SpoIIIJ protein YidD